VLDRNPVKDLDRDDRPSVGRMTEPRYLTTGEVDRLLARMTDTFRPIAACCALAGLRVSEALGLTWGDVDFDAKTTTVTGQLGTKGERVPTKTTSSNAPVPLLPALERELRAHRSRQAERDPAVHPPGRPGVLDHPWETPVPPQHPPRRPARRGRGGVEQ
jgi:integrase